ncbi:ABC transporter ATP-binding protein [Staphylococcus sp. SQ8-PEA]|uniref:ABC transporter ATP-binding protein n=1 Tax=Staphylococcus marylandisciuri TaxID=2981529 RepID=A0ABT2QPB0_9STAP|nr:ABC transporter ATP-binding protein [Staphylococcus marylandisciuri]MCU5745809.1 ABC transporter ATP-binding protein [Staphylococcus marylandisciuri]
MIEFKNVTKRYGDKVAVDDVSFNIKEGEFFVLIGPSGCGKTTTLKMMNRLIPLSGGYIYFNNKPISDYPIYEMRWDIGYVLQQIALFPHMTVRDNIAQVPQMKKWNESDIDERVDDLLSMINMDPEHFKYRKPDELSGGQRQRIGVIRALAADPPVILMDEPFSALDPISREKLQEDLIELQAKIKKTIVFVTHDITEAVKLGDRICLLNEGHIEQIGRPQELIQHPKNDFVKQFMGDQIEQYETAKLNHLSQYGKEISADVIEQRGLSIFDSEDTVEQVYAALAEDDAVAVKDERSHQYLELSRAAIFNYLSQTRERVGEKV